MAICNSFSECIGVTGMPASATTKYTSLSAILVTLLNALFYLLFAFLIVYSAYHIVVGIYKLILGKDEETMQTASSALKKSVYSVIGLIALLGARFFLATAVSMLGFSDAENPFITLPF